MLSPDAVLLQVRERARHNSPASRIRVFLEPHVSGSGQKAPSEKPAGWH